MRPGGRRASLGARSGGGRLCANRTATSSASQRPIQAASPNNSNLLTRPRNKLFLEEDASIRAGSLHPDRFVEADRGLVLGTHEQAHRRRLSQQQPAEVRQPALAVAAVSHLGIDPDLLQLDGARCPRRGFGLEENRPALGPEPRAAFLDLRERPAAKAVWIALERVDTELFLVCGSAGRKEQIEIVDRRRPQAVGLPVRGLSEHIDRLVGSILARLRHERARGCPELPDGLLVTDQHPRPARGGLAGKRIAAAAGRDDIGAEVAEGGEPVSTRHASKAPEAASRDVLEEDTLDRILGAEGEDRVERRIGQHGRDHRNRNMVRACRSTSEPSRASTPRPAFSPETLFARNTSPRPTSTTPSSETPSAGCWATRASSRAGPSPCRRPEWAVLPPQS